MEPAKLKNVSPVALAVGEWVRAMDGYYRVNLIVIPKKRDLDIAQKEYNVVAAELKIKQEELAKVVA